MAHYGVVKAMLSNPEWMAEKTVGTSKEIAEFKANSSIKGLKIYLTEATTHSPKPKEMTTKKASNDIW
jgi:hypothetical protein